MNVCSPWINQSIMQGLVLGSIFWQLSDGTLVSKFSLFFTLLVQSFFFNMVRQGARCLSSFSTARPELT